MKFMALEGTHIRFAIDLIDKYDIKDIKKYISGTLYPDSRYITKNKRGLTHSEKYLENEFAKDDFYKGWQAHLLCDEFQGAHIADITNSKNKKIEQFDDVWIENTVVKVLQEISDLKSFDISKYLQYIKLSSAPNDENLEMLNKYYELVRNFYAKSNLQIDDYRVIFSAFGIPKEIENKIIAKCADVQCDKIKMNMINDLYGKVLKEVKKYKRK